MNQLYDKIESTAEEIIRNELLNAGAKAEEVIDFAHVKASDFCCKFKNELKRLTEQLKEQNLI